MHPPAESPPAEVAASPATAAKAPAPARPAPVAVPLTAATLKALFAPRLGARSAAQLAELLDGASLIDVELAPDGRGRGELVHRQQRDLFVAVGTAAGSA